MKISTYLNFDGRCAEALALYAKTLGGEVTFMMTHGERPMKDKVSADWHEKIMHAALQIGDNILMGCDVPPEMLQTKPAGFRVSISLKDAEAARRIFAVFAEGGEVAMALQETFWAPLFGMVTDRYGTPWMIGLEPAQ